MSYSLSSIHTFSILYPPKPYSYQGPVINPKSLNNAPGDYLSRHMLFAKSCAPAGVLFLLAVSVCEAAISVVPNGPKHLYGGGQFYLHSQT